MDKSLYDEFGNYIGGELESSSSSSSDEEHMSESDEAPRHEEGAAPARQTKAIVLHEDKQYFQDAESVYGPGTETLVQEEDAQTLSEPILKAASMKHHMATDVRGLATTDMDEQWIISISRMPERIRNVAVVGHLHAGKTSLLDLVLRLPFGTRYMDTRNDEQQRGVSIKTSLATSVCEDSRGKSWSISWLDTPGHPQCYDGVEAALRVADGVVLCVDVVEGLLEPSTRILEQATRNGMKVVLVISKLDRAVLELRIPPMDTYHKLRLLVDQCNMIIRDSFVPRGLHADQVNDFYLSPMRGNVLFASGIHGFCFSLESFVNAVYPKAQGDFFKRLWGDIWFQPDNRTFQGVSPSPLHPRTFVEFVLQPLYKLYSILLSGEPLMAKRSLEAMGFQDASDVVKSDPQTLVERVLRRAFGDGVAALASAIARHIPSPVKNAAHKVSLVHAVHEDEALNRCSSEGPLVANTALCVWRETPNADFDGLTRIFSGTLRAESTVTVMGEQYLHRQQEDVSTSNVTGLWISVGRKKIPLDFAVAGQLVLVGGICQYISKTATLSTHPTLHTFHPLKQAYNSVMRVAVEPLNPSELPKLVESIRRANKCYGALVTRVEESGEHVLVGTGELFLDAVLYDIRKVFGDVEVKVSDPSVVFSETVVSASSLHCSATTPNQQNRISMVASPLDAKLVSHSEACEGQVDTSALETLYGWDMLKCKGLWTFGSLHTNALIDDTLMPAGSSQYAALSTVKPFMVQGFDWATREGPLTHDAMRGVSFSLIGAQLADQPFHRGGGQIIPAARRVMYSSFLTASPRLLEPVYRVDIQCRVEAVKAIELVLTRRRGHVVKEAGIPGTPLVAVTGYVPIIDSFGLETDLRIHTQGLAFCTQVFNHWDLVPGDPLDSSIILRPLEPQPVQALAREFMVKTRRRKGLSDDVTLSHYFDPSMISSVQSMIK